MTTQQEPAINRAQLTAARRESFVVLIPAYKPGPNFTLFVEQLIARGVAAIVVVDDGSGPAYQPYFEEAGAMPEVRLLRHGVNLGKGAALKTAMNAVLCDFEAGTVVVTADADGQHHADDVIRVGQEAQRRRNALVLGVRQFREGVPWRSRLGNELTRSILRLVVGQKLSDTQTGLRAIPFEYLALLMKVPLQGYEFELEMLLVCRANHIAVAEVPIRTIYLDGNSSSHFNPLLDSMRIYFVLLRFSLLSLGTALLDNLVFAVCFANSGSLAMSQIVARCVAMLFNFFGVKKVVFRSRGNRLREFMEYLTLVVVSGLASFGMIKLLVASLPLGVVQAKICAEAILFFVNFLVQRDFIFTGRKKPAVAQGEVDQESAEALSKEQQPPDDLTSTHVH